MLGMSKLTRRWRKSHPLTLHRTSDNGGSVTIYFKYMSDGQMVFLFDEHGMPVCFNKMDKAQAFARGECGYRQPWVEGKPASRRAYKCWLKSVNLTFEKRDYTPSVMTVSGEEVL